MLGPTVGRGSEPTARLIRFSGWEFPAGTNGWGSSLFVVGRASADLGGSVDLLCKNQPSHLVCEGEFAEREILHARRARTGSELIGKSGSAADHKAEARTALLECCVHELAQLDRGAQLALLVEVDDRATLRALPIQRCDQLGVAPVPDCAHLDLRARSQRVLVVAGVSKCLRRAGAPPLANTVDGHLRTETDVRPTDRRPAAAVQKASAGRRSAAAVRAASAQRTLSQGEEQREVHHRFDLILPPSCEAQLGHA
mmetsp:Transcript_13947/g.35478  ORF Transcript_13947/g.35478 Transcript_13947/m.35478 type:complete len:255 (+) Transcript_13947:187-951(+)